MMRRWAEELVEKLGASVLAMKREHVHDVSVSRYFTDVRKAYESRRPGATETPKLDHDVSADLAKLPAWPSLPAEASCIITSYSASAFGEAAEDFATSVYVEHAGGELAAVCVPARARTFSISSGESVHAGFGGRMDLWTQPMPSNPWDGQSRIATDDASRALARLLDGEVDIVQTLSRAFPESDYRGLLDADGAVLELGARLLPLCVRSEYGEPTWRGSNPTFGCFTFAEQTVRAWLEQKGGATRSVPGDPCPDCGAPLEDATPQPIGGMPPTGGEYEYSTEGPITLACTKCQRRVRSGARQRVYFDGRPTEYET